MQANPFIAVLYPVTVWLQQNFTAALSSWWGRETTSNKMLMFMAWREALHTRSVFIE